MRLLQGRRGPVEGRHRPEQGWRDLQHGRQVRRLAQALRGACPSPPPPTVRARLFANRAPSAQACGPNNGLVEVSVGPQSMPLAYVSVYKPGMGLVTSQTFGPVAGFSKDGEGNVVGLTTEDADGNKFVKYPPAPKPCGGD